MSEARAPAVAAAVLSGALEPLEEAEVPRAREGLERAAEMCAAHGLASGRSLSVLIRNHLESLRKETGRG